MKRVPGSPDLPAENRVFAIAIGGATCCGKTTLAAAVARAFPRSHAAVLSLDWYYRDLAHLPLQERERCNFDHPDSLDWPLLLSNLDSLAAGNGIRAPRYDFHHHVRDAGVRELPPARIVICEGLLALHSEVVRERFNVSVYIDVDDDLCFARRVARDVEERGRTLPSILHQYETTVRPMAREFILPSRRYADIVLDGTAPLDELVQRVLTEVPAAFRA